MNVRLRCLAADTSRPPSIWLQTRRSPSDGPALPGGPSQPPPRQAGPARTRPAAHATPSFRRRVSPASARPTCRTSGSSRTSAAKLARRCTWRTRVGHRPSATCSTVRTRSRTGPQLLRRRSAAGLTAAGFRVGPVCTRVAATTRTMDLDWRFGQLHADVAAAMPSSCACTTTSGPKPHRALPLDRRLRRRDRRRVYSRWIARGEVPADGPRGGSSNYGR